MARALVDLNVDQLRAEYDDAELRCDEAAEAERAAFDRWQEAVGAYEVARDESGRAWRTYSAAVTAA
jgi:hypothetical protein